MKMKNRLQQVLNAIALPFSSLKNIALRATAHSTTLAGSLEKTDVVAKNLFSIKDLYDNNGNLIHTYNSIDEMIMEKEEIKDKINRLFTFIDLMKNHIITLDQLREFINVLNEFSVLEEVEFNDLINKNGYSNIDELYIAIDKYKSSNVIEKSKLNDVIGSLSGSTYQTHIDFTNDYGKFYSKIKKK